MKEESWYWPREDERVSDSHGKMKRAVTSAGKMKEVHISLKEKEQRYTTGKNRRSSYRYDHKRRGLATYLGKEQPCYPSIMHLHSITLCLPPDELCGLLTRLRSCADW